MDHYDHDHEKEGKQAANDKKWRLWSDTKQGPGSKQTFEHWNRLVWTEEPLNNRIYMGWTNELGHMELHLSGSVTDEIQLELSVLPF